MEGYLYSRGKTRKTWYLTFDLPTQHGEKRKPGEKRKQRTVRLGQMPKNHAVARKREILRQIDKGTWQEERPQPTVEQFFESWLEAMLDRIATTTHVRYTGLVRRHVIPRIGQLRLSKVAPEHIRRIYEGIRASGLSAQTALHVHRVLHKAFADAVQEDRILFENVVRRVKSPRVGDRRTTPMSRGRVQTLIQAARGTRLEAPVVLAALTGLRRGEVLALKWAGIDFEKGLLYVSEALEHTRRHGIRFKSPKSHMSRRVLPLAPECVEMLRLHKEEQNGRKADAAGTYTDLDLVFPNPDGAPWPPDSFSVQFGKLARGVGCKGFRFHDLRHAFATLTLSDGVSIREVSDLLGHSSKAFTLSTYAHVMEGSGRAAVNSLARSLLPAVEVASAP